MGFMDELKKLARPYAEDDDDFEDDFDVEERPRASRASTAARPAPRSSSYDEVLDDLSSSGSRTSTASASRRSAGDSKVVNIHTTTQLQVVLVKPEKFEDASAIAAHLREKRTVVLNLESTNKEIARRLLDFLSGVAYANEGKIKKVAISTYIITPYNVDILGDLIDELENNGLYF